MVGFAFALPTLRSVNLILVENREIINGHLNESWKTINFIYINH
jgi:hypothetical protein